MAKPRNRRRPMARASLPEDDGWIDTTEMAKLLDVATPSLARGARSGRLDATAARKGPRGWEFNADNAKMQWYANTKADHIPDAKKAAEVAALQTELGLDTGSISPSQGDITDEKLAALREQVNELNGTEAKVAADRIKILKGEIELAQTMHELLRREDVYRMLFEFGQRVRQRLEEVPARVVDNVLACDDRIEAAGIIRDALDEALVELTRTPELKNG